MQKDIRPLSKHFFWAIRDFSNSQYLLCNVNYLLFFFGHDLLDNV